MDRFEDGLIFLAERLDLKAGQPLQTQVKNRLSLNIREAKDVHELFLGFLGILTSPDDRDNLIKVIHRDHETFEDMLAGFGLFKFITGTACDHTLLMVNVIGKQRLDAKLHRPALGDCHHVDAERHLKIGVLIEHGQDHHRVDVALDLDDRAKTGSVRLVADVVDAAEQSLLLLTELEDLFKHRSLRYLIRHFGDDDQLAARAAILNMYLRADGQFAAARLISALDFFIFNQPAARREVRSGHDLHDFFGRRLRIVHEENRCVDGLAQIVRRNVGRKADRNAGGAVDQQVGIARWQHVRLLEGVVKVEAERHGILVDVAQHLQRQRRHACFGITHRSGAVAVDGTEVAVTVDQKAAQAVRLSHTHHRVIDRAVAMRMIFAEAITDNTRALLMRFIRRHAQLVERKENAALDGL